MRKFAIITDGCSDLEGKYREKYNIDYVPMCFTCDEKEYVGDLDWKYLSAKDFYNLMRDGKRVYTSLVNKESVKEKFIEYLDKGYDILNLSCSSALSATYKICQGVMEELAPLYPEAKLICIDTLRACMALGIICIRAAELREEGKTIDEVADWVNNNKLTSHMEGSVESLKYLKQAGRVSATSAFFGGLLNIKPIIIADALGRNFALEKVKGRKVSIDRLVERTLEQYIDLPYQKMFIAHADCLDEALEFKRLILKALNKDIDIEICYVGPGVGASVGPGMISVYYFGEEVTVNKELQ